ncbi:MAG: VWA domain-containing protein [Planctomycetes bacterium]|nr:VWA domain-containing protein [Planctomycetota bacterium]
MPRTWFPRPMLVLAALGLLGSCHPGSSSLDARTPPLGRAAGLALQRASAPPAGFLPADEIWVIERPAAAAEGGEDEGPGTGSLVGRRPGETTTVPVPLRHTEACAKISAWLATVSVKQRFENPFDRKIEAVYVFPLPHDASVTEFLMTIGARRIRGIIREREEAREIYRAARQQGHVAALLTQTRPNVFTQSVANIEPGHAIDVDITYFHTLALVRDTFEFVFPMVVGPRFNPPGHPGGIGAAAYGGGRSSGQATEVTYLKPHERSGHDIALAVELDAGVPLEAVSSPSHAITVTRPSPATATVQLCPNDRVPNRDFVLHYRVAGTAIKSGLLAHRDERGGFFTLVLHPPADGAALHRRPVEMIFLVDCSGSMQGAPLAKVKTAVARALRRLEPGDAYQIVRFSDTAQALHADLRPATATNIGESLADLEQLQAGGGTMMADGIRAALTTRHEPDRLRVVSVMTDGYIGNETEVLAVMRRHLGPARIFSFGVGSAVNRYLLESLARLGRGAVAYVGLDESAGRAVDRFYEEVCRPALTDVAIDWAGLAVSELQPAVIPDLLVGRPLLLTGRFEGELPPRIRVHGKTGSESTWIDVPAADGNGTAHPALPLLWARSKIGALTDAAIVAGDPGELGPAIRQVALEFGLLSAETAFVAVDSLTRTAGDQGMTLQVPVPVPAGVPYDTTVPQ